MVGGGAVLRCSGLGEMVPGKAVRESLLATTP